MCETDVVRSTSAHPYQVGFNIKVGENFSIKCYIIAHFGRRSMSEIVAGGGEDQLMFN